MSIYGSQKGDEGADTDLMFQFCLSYVHKKKLHVKVIEIDDMVFRCDRDVSVT